MNLALLNAAPFRAIHVVALVLCAVFLPWSTAFLSMAQMLLVLNWLVEGAVRGDLRARFRKGFLSAPSAVFLSFLGLHMLGLLWTEDLHWGTGLVRILLPLLTFGVVLAGSPALGRREFRTVMLFGAWSAVTSALFCALFSGAGPGDYRSLSMFISHIRLVPGRALGEGGRAARHGVVPVFHQSPGKHPGLLHPLVDLRCHDLAPIDAVAPGVMLVVAYRHGGAAPDGPAALGA
jgi:hypothetical protein